MTQMLIGSRNRAQEDGINMRAVAVLCLAGVLVAVATGLYERYGIFAQLCAAFSDGCKQTLGYGILGFPLWTLGIVYFLVLLGSAALFPASSIWIVGVGLGFEAELVRTLVAGKVGCIFCIANGVLVVLTAAFIFRSRHFWQTLALALLAFMITQQELQRPRPALPAQPQNAQAAPEALEPTPDISNLPVDQRYVLGPENAPVVVVEFSDYQCPGCRKVHEVIKQIRPQYEGKLRWIFKDFPLRMHKDAARAAQAARCAADQGRFWEYQDLLYAAPSDLPDEILGVMAKQLGLDGAAFEQCLTTDKYKAAVEQSVQDALNANVDRTPTFFLNGEHLPGVPNLDGFKRLIDAALAKAPAEAK